jgi:hypothetical protein
MLPPFNSLGDLPPGVHRAAWTEIEESFGRATVQRVRCLAKIRHLHELARQTGKLARFLIFGSFVSDQPEPRDVDVILVMASDFRVEEAPRESQTLFSHPDAEARFGASVFWLRERMLSPELMRDFIDTWQIKRDGTKRGIVEITP